MENSNNDRWSLLATDLGIEVDTSKNNKVENDTDKTTNNNNNIDRNVPVIMPNTSVTRYTPTEPLKNTIVAPTTLTSSTTLTPPTSIPPTSSNPTHITNPSNPTYWDQ
ncbi:MAG: hypothetical protein LBC74_16285, partial [Planctomycetaceae bacterium]|nr:hypothetical protein [Planctomycetaceae bacterium]